MVAGTPNYREEKILTSIDPTAVRAGIRLQIVQAFVSQLRTVHEGEVTKVLDRCELGEGPWAVLNERHYFQLRTRASYSGHTCTQTFRSLRPAEPPDKSMWLVVVGLTRQVWVRDDSVLAKTMGAAKEGRHWYRVGEHHGYTWVEAFEVMGGNPMMRLRVENADPDQ